MITLALRSHLLRTAALVSSTVLAWSPALVAQSAPFFVADLDGGQEVPANASTATGWALIEADRSSGRVSVFVATDALGCGSFTLGVTDSISVAASGLDLINQAAVIDFGANPVGVVLTNAVVAPLR